MTKDKTPNLTARTRTQIAETLPHAIERAITSYHEFYDQDTPETAKEFSAHHGACKAAIAHIELLIKLAQWADLTGEKTQQDNLAEIIARAEKELNDYKLGDDGDGE